eukprot:scaffold4242_cov175-Amphora_coffeaeformis.AAC.8
MWALLSPGSFYTWEQWLEVQLIFDAFRGENWTACNVWDFYTCHVNIVEKEWQKCVLPYLVDNPCWVMLSEGGSVPIARCPIYFSPPPATPYTSKSRF